jgi:transposase
MTNPERRKVHIAEVKKTHNGVTYSSVYLRRTFLEDGNVGLPEILPARPCRERDLVMAMIVDRVISPGSKLSCSCGMNSNTAQNTLSEELALDDVDVHEFYHAMDWLLARQTRIENKLAKKHLQDGTLVLFDVSSSYYTGTKSELIQHGYSRDHRPDRPQIVYGLLCDRDGRPIAVEVLPGNTADPKAFSRVVETIRNRFGITNIIFVGDRGMITTARINEDLRDIEGLDWISALRSEQIKSLVAAGKIDRSLLDEKDLAEIRSEELFPGERLIVCRNPLLADERARKREELLKATERELDKIVAATQKKARPLHGKETIGLKVGSVINRFKMKKHFELVITDNSFTYSRREENIASEAALDGLYVIRTSAAAETMAAEKVVATYKSLSRVERAFRSFKSIDLRVRPIFHWKDDRIRAHVFLCMLAYYVEWHMRERLRDVLFDDTEREAAQAQRRSIVAPAVRSKSAKMKDSTRVNADGLPVQSFQDLLKDLATLCRNRMRLTDSDAEFRQLTESTPLQRRVLELLSIRS